MALDLELWLEASPTFRERTDDCPCECEIAGATSVAAPPESIHPPHGLRGQPYAGCERETPAVDSTKRDPARSARRKRVRHLPSRFDGNPGQPEGAREDARAAAGQEADREVRLEPVQGLVETAVAREDDDGLDAATTRAGHELRRMTRALGQKEVELGDSLELRADLGEPLLAHPGRERIDDERRFHRVA